MIEFSRTNSNLMFTGGKDGTVGCWSQYSDDAAWRYKDKETSSDVTAIGFEGKGKLLVLVISFSDSTQVLLDSKTGKVIGRRHPRRSH